MDLKGSKTEKNLYRTFAGESRARNKYDLYAEKAREEGYEWVAEIFEETAKNEYGHARRAYGELLGKVTSSEDGLMDAMMGESDEAERIYKRFEEEALEEGFDDIATFYKELQEVEEAHKERFKILHDKLASGTMFQGGEDSKWCCINCGYIHEGVEPPEICPLCKYPKAFFKPCCDIESL